MAALKRTVECNECHSQSKIFIETDAVTGDTITAYCDKCQAECSFVVLPPKVSVSYKTRGFTKRPKEVKKVGAA